MATPTLVAVHGATSRDDATVTVPNVVAGDWLVVSHALSYSPSDPMVQPTGSGSGTWYEIGTRVGDSLTWANMDLRHWRKVTTSSGTHTVIAHQDAGENNMAIVLHLRGATSIDGTPTQAEVAQNSGATTSQTVPAVTTSTPDALLVGFWTGVQFDGTLAYTAPPGMTERREHTTTTSMSHMGATQTLTAAGNTGSRTATTNLAARYGWAGALFAVAGPQAPKPTVDAGADAAVLVGETFSRTATDSDNGSAITAREWRIVSGPADVGVLSTAASVSYTPTVAGLYTLRYSATNAGGTASDDVSLTVTEAPTPPTVSAGLDVTHTVDTAFTRTASEVDNGSAITAREWFVVSGPAEVGTVLATTALVTWTPTVLGDYVLRYSATNSLGTSSDTATITVADVPVGPPSTVILDQNHAFQYAGQSLAVALPSAPNPNALCLSIFSGNKNVPTMTVGAPWTERAEYVGASVSGTLATATGAQSASWSWQDSYSVGIVGVFATNIVDWTYRTAATFPSPPTDTEVSSISGDLGTATAPGTVFCIVGVDSSYDEIASTWPNGSTITLSNGYDLIGKFQDANYSGQNAEGVAFLLGKKDVADGDSTAVTVAWSGGNPSAIADQAYLHLLAVDVTAVGGAPGTLTSSWLGVDHIALRLAGGAGDVQVAFSTSPDMTAPVYSAPVAPDEYGNARVPIPDSLAPDTDYYYQPYRGATLLGTAQPFRTLPAPSPRTESSQGGTFRFAFASCRNHTGDSPIMADFAARGVELFLQIGDLHYRNISVNDVAAFRAGYDELHTRPNLGGVLETIPTSYSWDDHDFGGNASHGGSAAKPAANQAYRERVPHPPLPASDSVFHTFKVGAARFVVLDCRSARSPVGNTDNSAKTMLGATQKAWLKNILAEADSYLTFVVSPVGWHSDGSDDDWGFYQTERAELAADIAAADTDVVMLCGDMHRLAVATPAQGTPGGVHVWHAAPLNQGDNGQKGGPYRDGSLYGSSQYGFVEVTETYTDIMVTFSAIRPDASVWTTDTVTVEKIRPVDLPEHGTAADPVTITGELSPLPEQGTGTDAISTEILTLRELTDAGTGTDTAQMVFFVGNDLTEQGVGADEVTVDRLTFVDLTDGGVGDDYGWNRQDHTVTDTGTGSDQIGGPVGIADLTDHGTGSEFVTVLDIPYTQVLPLTPGPLYELVVVARIPQVGGAPTFIEVDPIDLKSLSYTNTLSEAQELEGSCLISSVTEPVLQRLRRLHANPTELWLYRNGRVVFAGPLQGWRTSGESLTLRAKGMLAYLDMMIVTEDLVFDQVDQFSMVKSMIDGWQSLEYGHFGIGTATLGASGVLRDGTYLRTELHKVGQRVEELGKRINGFDIEINPATRELQLWHPNKGVDRSTGEDAIVLDARNITSGDVLCSVAPGDLASEAFGTGSSAGDDGTLWSAQHNPELRARYGRTAVTGTWSDVSEQNTLDEHTQALLDARDEALIVPGPGTRVTPDADLADYGVGDTISYTLASQLGVTGAFRIRRQRVSVSSTGQESVDVEFV